MQRVERRRGWMHKVGALFTISPTQRRFIEELGNSNTGAFELVLTPLILALAGYGLDRVLGTKPVLTVVFAALGFAGAVYKLYLEYTQRMKQAEEGKPWAK
ncbi:MAG: synthase protein [Actinomycetota bacterium]